VPLRRDARARFVLETCKGSAEAEAIPVTHLDDFDLDL